MLLLYRASRPYVAELGPLPEAGGVSAICAATRDAARSPGIVVLRIEAGLFFANAEPVRTRITAAAAAEGVGRWSSTSSRSRRLDVSAARMLGALTDDLGRTGVEVRLARVVGQVHDVLDHRPHRPASALPDRRRRGRGTHEITAVGISRQRVNRIACPDIPTFATTCRWPTSSSRDGRGSGSATPTRRPAGQAAAGAPARRRLGSADRWPPLYPHPEAGGLALPRDDRSGGPVPRPRARRLVDDDRDRDAGARRIQLPDRLALRPGGGGGRRSAHPPGGSLSGAGHRPGGARGRAKYEQPGRGPSLRQAAELLDSYGADPFAELDRLVATVAYTVAIGNADAHGKNLALLHPDPRTITLAPLYDTVPTALWPKLRRQAAMAVGGQPDLDDVGDRGHRPRGAPLAPSGRAHP